MKRIPKTHGGKRLEVTATTVTAVIDADNSVAALVPQVAPATPPHRHPVAVYLGRLAPGSRRTLRGAVEVIADILSSGAATAESLPWSRIEYQHAAAVRAALAARYAPATANKCLAALRGVLQECWRLGLMSAEQFRRSADLAPVRGERLLRGRALDAGELRALFRACAREPGPSGARDAAVLAALYGAGLRREEVASLEFTDYDGQSGELRVRKAKGGKQRLVFATNGGKDAIAAWIALRGTISGPLFLPVGKGIAGAVRPGRMSGQAIYAMVLRRARQSGVAKFSPHDLRRGFVSDLLDAGADLATVQTLAGHASPTTTARYDRRGDVARRKAAELLHVPYVPSS